MPKPSWDEIDLRIRQIIADDKHYHVYEVHDEDLLRDTLGYDDLGLTGLGPDINAAFFKKGKGLTKKQILSCLKVIGLPARVDEQPIKDFK